LSGAFSLARAGRWFLQSGIQRPDGGVSRYLRADAAQYKPVSTEITGYTASALIYLFRATGREEYLHRARLTARFLCDTVWDPALRLFPFESPSPTPESPHRAYFFDCGIIIRGLLAVWRETGEDRLVEISSAASHGMLAAFQSGDGFHPILELPGLEPLPRTPHWSRSATCYQAKSALAWWDVSQITGDAVLRDAYLAAVEAGLRNYPEFLPGTDDRHGVMDRLHPACYFLEALSPLLDRAECVDAYRFGLETVGRLLREIAPEFVRSDVYAQLLRARVFGAGAVPLDTGAAAHEAAALARFQATSDDPGVDGGVWFGRRHGQWSPQVNPVSTAFAIQALGVWEGFQNGLAPTMPPS